MNTQVNTQKNPMAALRVAGLVLAGGRSRRFGGEKAMAILEGRTLLGWSLAALVACCERVAVSAGPSSGAEALARDLGHPVLYDDPAHARGPLAGLAAGLAWARREGFDLLATLPCDTPHVGASEITTLIAVLDDGTSAFASTADGPQPLCAVWRVELAPVLETALSAGDHPSVRALHAALGAKAIWFDNPAVFDNLNTMAAPNTEPASDRRI